MAAQTRGFLFSDLRGYSAYTERHGDRAARALLTAYRGLVREAIASFGGAEIRTEGDSFYVVFGSVSQAVEAGLAIQAGLIAAANADQPIPAGIGIHAGEVEDDAEQGIVSGAVNIAARLCSAAEPGEVLVSDTVRGLTRGYLDVTYLPRGRRRLKGIAEPMPVYRALAAGSKPAAARRRWVLRGRGPSPLATAPLVAGLVIIIGISAVLGGTLLRESLAGDSTESGASGDRVAASATVSASSAGAASPSVVPLAVPSINLEVGPDDDWPVHLDPGVTYALTNFRPQTSASLTTRGAPWRMIPMASTWSDLRPSSVPTGT